MKSSILLVSFYKCVKYSLSCCEHKAEVDYGYNYGETEGELVSDFDGDCVTVCVLR